jgi:acetyl esterase/lipase
VHKTKAITQAATNAGSLGADPRKGFILMGTSAGGHLAAITARRARDDPLFRNHPITGQILRVPVTCHPDAYPKKCADKIYYVY